MKHYEVEVTVHGATPPKGNPIVSLTFIVKADSPENAAQMALDSAKLKQLQHPRMYKNATFSVSADRVKIF